MSEDILAALAFFLQPDVLGGLIAGALLGMGFGVLPGLGAASGTALLVSATYTLSTESAIAMLMGIYCAATYSGSITACAVGIPGTASASASVLDGYALGKSGKLDRALTISVVAAVFGGIMGVAALHFLTEPIANIAIKFGAPEYFAIGVVGLTMISSLAGGMLLGGFLFACFGLVLSTIGIDQLTGVQRFTFGSVNLLEGISVVPVLIGLFAVSEAMMMLLRKNDESVGTSATIIPFFAFNFDWSRLPVLARVSTVSGVVGILIGAIPGIGAATATWIGYNEGRRVSSEPEQFGKGSEEGLSAAETGANASVAASLIPLLSFGIPGSGTSAVLLGALMLHGVVPGPSMFRETPHLFPYIVLCVAAGYSLVLVLGIFGVGFWVRLLRVPRPFIVVTILMFAIVGAFSLRSNVFDVYVTFAFGLIGFLIRRAGFTVVPVVLAVVLGELVEQNFRRSLFMSDDGGMIFLQRPVTACLLLFGFLSFSIPFISKAITQSRDENGCSSGSRLSRLTSWCSRFGRGAR